MSPASAPSKSKLLGTPRVNSEARYYLGYGLVSCEELGGARWGLVREYVTSLVARPATGPVVDVFVPGLR